MTDERVEPTREWLDALIDGLEVRSFDPKYSSYAAGFKDGSQFLRDAILASQPERVECPTNCTTPWYPHGSWLVWFERRARRLTNPKEQA